jgi:hypothetical protein
VKTEAAEAMRRKILVPALIDETKIPLEFRRLQAADLSQWQGEPSHPELEKFSRSIEENINSVVEPVPDPKPSPQPPPIRRNQWMQRRSTPIENSRPPSLIRWVLGGIGIVAPSPNWRAISSIASIPNASRSEQRIAKKQEQVERKRIAKKEAAREAALRKAEEDRRTAAERAAQLKAAQEQAARAARARAAQQPAERVTPGVYPAR